MRIVPKAAFYKQYILDMGIPNAADRRCFFRRHEDLSITACWFALTRLAAHRERRNG
eukprot:CAMPEP_0176147478 /NCGR_PEP_ID=MMETSP0120_2-20121206/75182_1 /TAXON_ID=160619 /ORGANISM="Kryptoperidinium foliaceum, Strain CCMP 1326" /LENGTH=56 /DNA_ID=CAMNT_0017484097 /DNA_START=161 /DNA_END=331 /DNA_ORIENTATION=+